MDPKTLFRMLGIDFDDFKEKIEEFLAFTRQILETLDTNIRQIHERQVQMDHKLDLILEKLGEKSDD